MKMMKRPPTETDIVTAIEVLRILASWTDDQAGAALIDAARVLETVIDELADDTDARVGAHVGGHYRVDWDGACDATVTEIDGDRITLERSNGDVIVVDAIEFAQMLR